LLFCRPVTKPRAIQRKTEYWFLATKRGYRMKDVVFALMPDSEGRARVLVRSLRTFGGALADRPVWVMVSAEPAASEALSGEPGVELMSFDADPDARAFPFGMKANAAAAAEQRAEGQTARLVWLDVDTLFLHEPGALLIPADKRLGYCPVHHRLIGSLYDAPPDAFWSLMYEACGVPAERVFPMRTIIGAETIRPYINAGLMVVRPEAGLLRAWWARFAALYRDPRCEAFYQQHALYRIFVHQTILAAGMLAELAPGKMIELPRTFNYPLHLYADDPHPPAALDDLITCRYESIFLEPGWAARFPISGALRAWIAEQFANT
jgi:hypothetical protein